MGQGALRRRNSSLIVMTHKLRLTGAMDPVNYTGWHRPRKGCRDVVAVQCGWSGDSCGMELEVTAISGEQVQQPGMPEQLVPHPVSGGENQGRTRRLELKPLLWKPALDYIKGHL